MFIQFSGSPIILLIVLFPGTSLNKSSHEDDADMFREAIVNSPNELQGNFNFIKVYCYSYRYN